MLSLALFGTLGEQPGPVGTFLGVSATCMLLWTARLHHCWMLKTSRKRCSCSYDPRLMQTEQPIIITIPHMSHKTTVVLETACCYHFLGVTLLPQHIALMAASGSRQERSRPSSLAVSTNSNRTFQTGGTILCLATGTYVC